MCFSKQIRQLAFALAATCCMTGALAADQITVFAASSLKETLEEVAADFGAETGHNVVLSFAGSSALARQIEFGAPADIFISASTEWMDHLAQKSLIDPATRFDLVANKLVLVGPVEGATQVLLNSGTDMAALLKGGRLAMALTDAVPAGIYGKAALENLGLWDDVAASVAQTDNVRAALALVALGAAPLGIVYATDARADETVAVLAFFPEASQPDIRYPAAKVAGSNTAAAGVLLDYLRSPAADSVFVRNGFELIQD
ncbi:MAG: molybdate ABC transporter substrate-binding protein [Roseobacter sp.]